MENLDDLYRWFDGNRDAIIEGHEEESALLRKDAVISYFHNDNDALEYAQNAGFSMGEFLIQECIPKDAETMYYHNEAVNFG